ncbi:MAG: hypothetical protein KIT69_10500, partial [Propionibacteriaceae bacterium]|nr:hypothetical protein [Propionibacteriaceae bacterium]
MKIRTWHKAFSAVLAVAASLALAACSSGGATPTTTAPAPTDPGSSAPADTTLGVDDGTELTMWTRAPLERQAKALVEAYNASHSNQVKL